MRKSRGMTWGALLVLVLCSACAQVEYYAQAAHGQFSLLAARRNIDVWLEDPSADASLKQKLESVLKIREFAVRELGLPDNGSYRAYADLQRPYVLWNVAAAGELTLKPEQWCFPVAGCVNYRGYYQREMAQKFADRLRVKGFDVQMAGVPAYSTLGWFDDPVLSTFIHYPEGELARLIFHELAHQVVYVRNDTKFNESFAVAVEEAGVARWLELEGTERMRAAYAAHRARKRDFLDLLLTHRARLAAIYDSPAPREEKLRTKALVFKDLQDDYRLLKQEWGGYAGYDRWFAEPLSNAHLAMVALYHDYVPGFHALLEREGSFEGFYRAVRALGKLDPPTRQAFLQQAGSGEHVASQ